MGVEKNHGNKQEELEPEFELVGSETCEMQRKLQERTSELDEGKSEIRRI